MKNGELFSSQEYNYHYSGNCLEWQTLKSDSAEVNWYGGELDYGKDEIDP